MKWDNINTNCQITVYNKYAKKKHEIKKEESEKMKIG